MANRDIDFGFVITAVGEPGASDEAMYREIFNDVEHGIALGYSTAWMIEHHFSDYFPTANPLQLLAFIAGRYPEIALGTCVLVLPWYQPLRLAEDIAQLRLLTDKADPSGRRPRHSHPGVRALRHSQHGRNPGPFPRDARKSCKKRCMKTPSLTRAST